jgi:hypothetical protein
MAVIAWAKEDGSSEANQPYDESEEMRLVKLDYRAFLLEQRQDSPSLAQTPK